MFCSVYVHSEAVLRGQEGLVVVGHSNIMVFDTNTLHITGCLDFRGMDMYIHVVHS